MKRLLLLGALACLPACFGNAGGSYPDQTQPTSDGRIFLSWTIGGQAPSTTACQGVDHLSLSIDYGGAGVTISPIGCTFDRLRYDHLPEGSGVVRVDALSATGCLMGSGSAPLDVTTNLPSTPSPVVAISALSACP